MKKTKRKKTKGRLWKANSLQCLSSEFDIRIRLHEEESLQTLAECRQWLSWRSLLQMRGPATVKARLPTVESLTGGTRRWLVLAECSVRRPGRLLTSASGPRYRSAVPLSILYVITATLYSIRWGTCSQWWVTSASVIWSADLIW